MYKLPKRFQWATFSAPELDPDNQATRVNAEAAIRLGRVSFDALAVVLIGKIGTGKTVLAIAMGREAMRHGGDCNGMFATALQLDKARREAQLGRGDAEDVQRAIDVPVLVLDELGAEDGKDSAVSEVIHERHDAMRQTFVTSSLPLDQLVKNYSGGIARRLLEGAVRIDCEHEEQPKPSASPILRVPPGKPLGDLPGPRRTLAELRGEAGPPRPLGSRAELEAALEGIGKGGAT